MRKSKFFSILLLALFVIFTSHAQDIPVGIWRTQLSFAHPQFVAGAGSNQLLIGSQHSLYVYNVSENTSRPLSKLDGLASMDITSLGFDLQHQHYFVGYSDGRFDVLNTDWKVLKSVKAIAASERTGSKAIQKFYVQGNTLYVATSFGVVLFQTSSYEVLNSWVDLGTDGSTLAVNDISISGDSVFLATDQGLWAGNQQVDNLKDYRSWVHHVPVQPVAFAHLVSLQSRQYLTQDTVIWRYDQGNWSSLFQSSASLHFLKIQGSALKAGDAQHLYTLSTSGQVQASQAVDGALQDWTYDQQGKEYWVDQANGFSALANLQEPLFPQGPLSNTGYTIKSDGNKILAFQQAFSAVSGGFSKFEKGLWENYRYQAGASSPFSAIPDIVDWHTDELDPSLLWILSATKGLYALRDGTVVASPQDMPALPAPYEFIQIVQDAEGKMWVLTNKPDQPVFAFNPQDLTWKTYNFYMPSAASHFLVIANGDLWFQLYNQGIEVYNPTEDTAKQLTIQLGQGGLPSNEVLSMAEDKDGAIWVGTTNGVGYFPNPYGVLTEAKTDLVLPVFDGFFLFRDKRIKAIAIDGGNRKWMATEDGVWLFDENIEQNLLAFNPDNSPLPDAQVNQIAINDASGEVFFATASGLYSYRADATQAEPQQAHVKIFPNPVSLSRNTRVTIEGLAYKAEVKITDISGRLVYKGTSNGGSLSWNLQTYRGGRVQPGVYLVFAADVNGEHIFKGKFAIKP